MSEAPPTSAVIADAATLSLDKKRAAGFPPAARGYDKICEDYVPPVLAMSGAVPLKQGCRATDETDRGTRHAVEHVGIAP